MQGRNKEKKNRREGMKTTDNQQRSIATKHKTQITKPTM